MCCDNCKLIKIKYMQKIRKLKKWHELELERYLDENTELEDEVERLQNIIDRELHGIY